MKLAYRRQHYRELWSIMSKNQKELTVYIVIMVLSLYPLYKVIQYTI